MSATSSPKITSDVETLFSAGLGEVDPEIADATARSDRRHARRAPGRGARLSCSTARARRSRSARPARCRRRARARRSPAAAGGTAPRRRTWCCRRRSSWCADGAACRPGRCHGSFVWYFASTLTARELQLSFSRAHVVAAFEQQNPLARRREVIGERAAARAGADDDHVVVRHAGLSMSSGTGRCRVRWQGDASFAQRTRARRDAARRLPLRAASRAAAR